MSGTFRFRPITPAEAPEAAQRARLSFGATGDFEPALERWRARAEEGHAWALADAETDAVLGQTILRVLPHWFGGAGVPCQQVGAVGVAPEHRGMGIASALMVEALQHAAREGAGMSLLFPASGALYRGLGWECAGTFTSWRVGARHVPAQGPALRPLEDDWPAIEACHRGWAATLNGPEHRPPDRWEALRDRTQFAYGLDAADGRGLEGYVLVEHERQPDHWQHRLGIVDWAAGTPRALQALVGFVGRHGTLAAEARLRGPTPHPWALHVTEQDDFERVADFDWMARAVDLPAAVEARGFTPGLALSVTFTVEDDVLDEQVRGPWRLEVTDGTGHLERFPGADVRLHATAVGPLLTGYRSASDLAAAGRASGHADALALLDAAFAGPLPTLLDFF